MKVLKNENMLRIRDLKLLNRVPMKQIQEWLGHADFGTTANIYSHLDYSAKQNSANTISNVFSFVESKPKKKNIKNKSKNKILTIKQKS